MTSGPLRTAALSDRWRIKKGGKDRSNMTVTVFQWTQRFNGPQVNNYGKYISMKYGNTGLGIRIFTTPYSFTTPRALISSFVVEKA